MPVMSLSPGARNSWMSQHAFASLVEQTRAAVPVELSDAKVEAMRAYVNSHLKTRNVKSMSVLDLHNPQHVDALVQTYQQALLGATPFEQQKSWNTQNFRRGLNDTVLRSVGEFDQAVRGGTLLVNGVGFTQAQRDSSLRAFSAQHNAVLGIRFTDLRNRAIESVALDGPSAKTFALMNECPAYLMEFNSTPEGYPIVRSGKAAYGGQRFRMSARMQNFCRNQMAFGELLHTVSQAMSLDIPERDFEQLRNIMVGELERNQSVPDAREFDTVPDTPEGRQALASAFDAAFVRWERSRVGGKHLLPEDTRLGLFNSAISRSREMYQRMLSCTMNPDPDLEVISPSMIPLNTLGLSAPVCDRLGLKRNEPSVSVYWADIYDNGFRSGQSMVSPFESADNIRTFQFAEIAATSNLYHFDEPGYLPGADLGYKTMHGGTAVAVPDLTRRMRQVQPQPPEQVQVDPPRSSARTASRPEGPTIEELYGGRIGDRPNPRFQVRGGGQPAPQPAPEPAPDSGQYSGYDSYSAGGYPYDSMDPDSFGAPPPEEPDYPPISAEELAMLDMPDELPADLSLRAEAFYSAPAGQPDGVAVAEPVTSLPWNQIQEHSSLRKLFSSSQVSYQAQMDYFARQSTYRDLIEGMNASLAKRGLDKTYGVKTTTACLLLDSMPDFNGTHPRDLPAKMREAIDKLPSDGGAKRLMLSALEDAVRPKDGVEWYEKSIQDFQNRIAREDILTLSPFDLNFRNRKAALQRGNGALYTRMLEGAGEVTPLEGNPANVDLSRHFLSGWNLYDYVYDWQHDEALMKRGFTPNTMSYDELQEFSKPDGHLARDCKFVLSESGREPDMLLSPSEDLSGLSALRPYMSPKDYQAISSLKVNGRPWCAACLDENGKPKYMSGKAIERVRKTAELLRMSGEQFSFEPDSAPGQIRIKFDNGMTMRIIDPSDESYAGNSVRTNGTSIYYQVENLGGRSFAYSDITPEMAVDLVKYARGERVARRDNLSEIAKPDPKVYGGRQQPVTLPKYLGEPMSVVINGKPQQMSYHNGAHTMFNTVVNVGPYITGPNSATPSTGTLVITCNYEKRRDSEMCFDDVVVIDRNGPVQIPSGRERAETYLRKCVDDAKAGFQKELNVEDLIAEAMRRRVERNEAQEAGQEYDDSAPMCMSTNPDIAAIQAQYWDVLMGNQNVLMRPGYDTDDFESADDVSMANLSERAYFNMDAADMVRAHANDLQGYLIGEFEPTPCIDPDDPSKGVKGLRFNPVLVNRYMSGANMSNVNSNNITNACRAMGFTADDMRYTSFGGAAVSSAVRLQRMVAQDKMVNYKPETARNMMTADFGSESKNAFMREMGQTIMDSLRSNGCGVRPGDLMIDEQGIVRYKATRAVRSKVTLGAGSEMTPEVFEGEIGRLYAPEDNGVVRTRSHCMVPGYTAYIEPNKPGENRPYEERMVLKGYKDVMKDAIGRQIRSDLSTRQPYVDGYAAVSGVVLGDVGSLDSTLRHITSNTKYPHDFLDDEKVLASGMTLELRDVIIKTMSKRVKFEKEFMNASNEMPVFAALNGTGSDRRDLLNDRCMDALTLTGYRNLALLDSPGDGMFDPYFTGNANAQGVRYLVEGATIDENGHVVRADKNARCEMVNYLERTGRHPNFDSPDRMNMTGNGLLQCIRETKPVGVAQLTAGVWTLDDGLIVTKRFAEEYAVPDAHTGESRPLGIGDKIECHGNKGVIGIVIDPDMPEAEAKEKGLWNLVQMFKANEGLDVIMSSYSGVSRFNAGLAAEAVESNPEDLVNPMTGEVHAKSIGHVHMTILKQTADSKTHYDEEGSDVRSYGAQMSWALAAMDCPNIMKDTYRTNMKAFSTMREMMIVSGLDMDPTGRFEMSYTPHPGEVRNVFPLQDLWMDEYPTRATKGPGLPGLRLLSENAKNMEAEFSDWLEHNGGFMELPFELEYPCRDDMVRRMDQMIARQDERPDYKRILQEMADKGITRENIGKTQEYNPENFDSQPHAMEVPGANAVRKLEGDAVGFIRHTTEPVPGEVDSKGRQLYRNLVNEQEDLHLSRGVESTKTYLLPVMSSYLRAGQEFEESGIKPHDYTQHYMNVYKQGLEYRKAAAKKAWFETYKDQLMPILSELVNKKSYEFYGKVSNADEAYAAEIERCDANMKSAKSLAQAAYNKITTDIETRRFAGKRNIVRTGIMANKQANSCTAIWTADPRLGVDEIGMNPEMMQSLNLKEGDYCMMHRDPVLRGSAVRYMRVKPNEELVGLSVHPAGVPKGMDGDFDGDTVAPHSLPEHNKAARIEAMNKLSVSANLLDYTVEPKTVKDENGNDVNVYPLFIATGQDIAAGFARNPELQKRLDKLTLDVNRMEQDSVLAMDHVAKQHAREDAIKQINGILHDSAEAGFGCDVISYASKLDNVRSVESYVKAGAKGKIAGVDTYAKFLGVDYERDDNGEIKEDTIHVYDENIASRAQRCGVLKAKNVQQQFTGSAGSITIQLMTALANVDPKAATEVGHKGTQTVLQVKHSPEDGMHYELLLNTAVPHLRNGTKLRQTTQAVTYYDADAVVRDAKGQPVMGEDGQPMTGAFVSKDFTTWQPELYWNRRSGEWKNSSCTRDDYADQYDRIYNTKEGFNVGLKREYIDRVADILAKPNYDAEGKDRVMNMSRDFVDMYGAPMQKCAYGGDAHTIYNMAFDMSTDKSQPGLFDMPAATKATFQQAKNLNACMADGSATGKNLLMRDMQMSMCKTERERDAVRENLKNSYIPISRSDTLVGGKPRVNKSGAGERLAGTLDYDELLKAQSAALGIDAANEPAMNVVAPQPVVKAEPVPVGSAVHNAETHRERVSEPAPVQPVESAPAPEPVPAGAAAALSSIDLSQGANPASVPNPPAPAPAPSAPSRTPQHGGCQYDLRGLDVDAPGGNAPSVGYGEGESR